MKELEELAKSEDTIKNFRKQLDLIESYKKSKLIWVVKEPPYSTYRFWLNI